VRAGKRLTFGLILCLGLTLGGAPEQVASAKPGPATTKRVESSDAQRIVDELAAKIEKLGAKVGASVVRIEDGAELGSHDAARPINPASNAKIPTAAAALLLLGPQHRFSTGLFGNVEGGTVAELVLRGRGDPGFSTADLRDLVRELRTRGVTKVEKILVDQGAFSEWLPPAFEQQPNEWAPFRAPVAAVSLNRNVVSLFVRPGENEKDAAVVIADPPGFVDFEGQVRTTGRDAPEKLIADLSAKGDHLTAKLGGVVPLGKGLVPVYRRVDDPRALAGYALRAVLREQGVTAGDGVRVGESKEKRTLATVTSAPVGELVGRLGKDSDNFTAEMLFLALSSKQTGGATFAASAGIVEGVLREAGALGDGTVIKNGSGLFDANRIGAKSLTALLRAGARDPRISAELVAQLAIGGVDGTLKNRLTRFAESRTVRAKSGTLASVIALSGYVLGADGQPAIAFSFLVDGAKGKTGGAREAIDDAVAELADKLR
jgi:serine-type D-Ala-D-Ala carboxypeptidase/endopeptidase (penicillin-binding protein 4)